MTAPMQPLNIQRPMVSPAWTTASLAHGELGVGFGKLPTPKPSQIYRLAETYMTADQYVVRWMGRALEKAGPIKRFFVKVAGNIGEKLGKNDFCEFAQPNWPKMKFAEPSQGSLMWMMYIGLLGARAHRAYQRGELPNGKRDYREMMDVFRRDMWGITLYIFGLFTVNKWLAQLTQGMSGLKLANKKGAIITFSEHDINAHLANEKVLAAHMKQGNLKGLLKAANHNGYLGVPQELAQANPQAAKTLDGLILQFRRSLNPLSKLSSAAVEAGRHHDQIHRVSQQAMPLLNKLAAAQESTLKSLMTSPATQSAPWVKRWQPYKDFFAHYAKNQRAPLDLYSCIALFILLGYGPIWFNQWWTERQYNKRIKELESFSHPTQGLTKAKAMA